MKLNDAIKTLDDVIPAPDNKMVDGDHKGIAIAWKEIREYLTNLASKPTGERLTQRNDRGLPYFPRCFREPCNGTGCADDDCPFITEVCQKLADYEDESDRKDKGCFWCKEQIDEFGDSRVTASEITVVSRDRFGKRKLPRNFCPVCGRQLEEELKDETETL